MLDIESKYRTFEISYAEYRAVSVNAPGIPVFFKHMLNEIFDVSTVEIVLSTAFSVHRYRTELDSDIDMTALVPIMWHTSALPRHEPR